MTDGAARLQLALGDRYAIERVLGEGGMATVYLARDIRHARRVALKVMRPELAGAVGVERFLQEIRTTASLQHPHIVPLHDSGEIDGTAYYVMAYVEGESLRDRLVREGALPVGDAVRIAREVAEALDYAHRHGILHRDIKPENILLHEQRALVADFGVALAFGGPGDGSRLTASGLSVGTPQYMSPEQAMGERAITPRADIFALGAVLYEMLAGAPPFTGPTAQAIVARTLTQPPVPIRDLRSSVPEHVADSIGVALEQLPGARCSTAAEFASALGGATSGATGGARPAASTTTGSGRGAIRTVPRGRVAMLLLTAIAITALATWSATRVADRGSAGEVRATIPLDAGQSLVLDYDPVDLTRDGRYVVFVAETDGRKSLFVRALADTASRLLAGTDGARDPFFSHDGAWIAFFAGDRLMKVPRGGGAPTLVATLPGRVEMGGSWGEDGTILVAMRGRIHRIADGRPVPEPLALTGAQPADSAAVASQGTGLRDPSLLPGDRTALVTTDSGIALVDLARGVLHVLMRGSHARYVPSGHLLFDDGEGRIRVIAFDPRSGSTTGTSVPVFEAFRTSGAGRSLFEVSDVGTLLYVPGTFQRKIVHVSRAGLERLITNEARGYRFPIVSPDGRTIGVTVDPRPSEVWLIDATRGTGTRVSVEGRHSLGPVWAPDGQHLLFSEWGGQMFLDLRGGLKRALGSPSLAGRSVGVTQWLPDGRLLAREGIGGWHGERRIVLLTPGSDSSRILSAPGTDEDMPALSPDGRWLAFAANATSVPEVHVRALDGTGSTQVVSVGGGEEPIWSRTGDELFYRHGSTIMAARVRTRPDFAVLAPPTPAVSGSFDFSQSVNWDVGPDGGFVLIRSEPTIGSQFRVIIGWDAARAARTGEREP